MKLEFALANNPLWLVRDKKIDEFKPDKMRVGKHSGDPVPFRMQTMALQKGDIVYTFTDGYADQFGGPNGKKFKYKQLQQLLMLNSDKTMTEQKNSLEKTLSEWK